MSRRNRAERRHQAKRAKQRARRHIQANWSWDHEERYHGIDEDEVGIRARTPKDCSGPCCGNQRKYHGRTHKELAAEADTQDQINNWLEEREQAWLDELADADHDDYTWEQDS